MRPPCNLVPLGIRASSAVLLGAALPGGRVPGGPHGAGRDRHSWPHGCAAGKTPPPASPPLLWPVRPGAQSWGAVSASSAKTAGAAKPASCPDHVTRQSPGSRCSGPPPAGSQPASGPGAPRTWLWPLGVNEDASSVLTGSGQAAGPEDTAGPGPPLAPLLCRAPGPCRPQACTGWAARVSALPAGAGACSQRRQASRKAATVPERAATVSARDRLPPDAEPGRPLASLWLVAPPQGLVQRSRPRSPLARPRAVGAVVLCSCSGLGVPLPQPGAHGPVPSPGPASRGHRALRRVSRPGCPPTRWTRGTPCGQVSTAGRLRGFRAPHGDRQRVAAENRPGPLPAAWTLRPGNFQHLRAAVL